MSDAKLEYLGPVPLALTGPSRPVWWRRIPIAFIVVVIAPTLITAFYFLLIASPRYVSESRFVVRAPSQTQPSSIGVALQGVGLSAGQSDAFAVHEYINSRDGMNDLRKRLDLRQIFGRRGADAFSRYPHPWEGKTDEDLFKGYRRFVEVGYDSTSGMSTLRVEAFNPSDAKAIAEGLLTGGEGLVNRLNERSALDAVADAERARTEAQGRLAEAQARLAEFRNRERFIDPAGRATESARLISSLLETVAQLSAERSQLASQAPQSPQLPAMDNRIAAYQRQVETERAKVAGDAGSLVPKIGVYEDLVMSREFADRELAQATAALLTARQDARKQKLYLDRVVNPSLPDKADEPKRLFAILTVLLSTLMIYGVGWLVWAGVREHGQD